MSLYGGQESHNVQESKTTTAPSSVSQATPTKARIVLLQTLTDENPYSFELLKLKQAILSSSSRQEPAARSHGALFYI